VTFAHGDAQVHDFEPSSFDVAISQFGSMFFSDQVAAFANIARALKPGGRVVLVSWRRPTDVELMREISRTLGQKPLEGGPPPEAISPFRHADPSHTGPLLEQAGLVDVVFTEMDEPMLVGADVDAAFDYLVRMFGWQSSDLDEAGKAKAHADLRASLEEHQTDDGLAYGTATWLITAARA
jgi:SAM-dependent methyltransferase